MRERVNRPRDAKGGLGVPVVVLRALVEQAAVQSSVENAARILHRALHFVEHNAFQHEAAASVAFEPVALL
jgi:hypothetical protein